VTPAESIDNIEAKSAKKAIVLKTWLLQLVRSSE